MKRINNKTGIIYVAVDYKDANEFLKRAQEAIGNETETKIDSRFKTLVSPEFFIEAISIMDCNVIRNYRAKYIALSERSFEVNFKELHKFFHLFERIKLNLIFGAKEISMEQFMEILRNGSKKYCATCRWYSPNDSICCNGDSAYVADFRCLDDSCELWERDE